MSHRRMAADSGLSGLATVFRGPIPSFRSGGSAVLGEAVPWIASRCLRPGYGHVRSESFRASASLREQGQGVRFWEGESLQWE